MNIDTLVDTIIANKNKWAYEALTRIEADMKTRIFNEGKDVQDVGLGKYSPKYAKYRQENSKQIGYKDLEFDGDLRRSIQVGTSGDRTVLGYIRDNSRLIAQGQEKQTKKIIFKPSASERKAALETFKYEFERYVGSK